MNNSRKRLAVTAAVAVVAIIAAAGFLYHVGRVPWPRRQNVVLIVVDTLRSDHLPSYGYSRNTAPFLSEVAKGGAQFDAVSPTSWTKPAVASILTGLHPVRHQACGRMDVLPASVPALAAILAANGYKTIAFSSNSWISRDFGMDRGFEEFSVMLSPNPTETTRDAPEVNKVVLPAIHLFTKQPFFLYVHYTDPHSPYRPLVTWDGQPIPPALKDGLTTDQLDGTSAIERPPDQVQKAIDLYDGEIRQTDNAIAELIGALKKSLLLRNTLVIVTADHGEELQDHGRFGHGQTLLGEVTRVPMIISGPGIPPGTRTGLASLMDIAPTVLDYLNIDTPDGTFDGTSIVPTLANRSTAVPERDLLFHLDYQDAPKVGDHVIRVGRAGLALMADMQKFVINKNPYQQALFDLRDDPRERTDRTAEKPGIATDLAKRLADEYNAYSHRRAQRVTAVASNETIRSVRALGYLSGPDSTEPRNIPPGIRPASADSSGTLGWIGAVSGCINTADSEHDDQLLKGWSYPEPDGRWTEQEATAIVSTEQPAQQQLVVTGINHRPDPYTLTISFDGATVATAPHPARGPVRIAAALPAGVKAGQHVVKISTDSAYQPSAHGQGDTRRLGFYVSSICVK